MGPLNECEDLRAQSPAQSRGKVLGEEIERQHQIQEHEHTGMERIHYKLENQFWLRMSKLRRPSRTGAKVICGYRGSSAP